MLLMTRVHVMQDTPVSSTLLTLDFDFASCNAVIKDFDDGHLPENFKRQSDSSKLVHYPQYFDDRPATVLVIDEAIDDTNLVKSLYATTAASPTPWGTYVSIEQLNDVEALKRESTTQQTRGISNNKHLLDSTTNDNNPKDIMSEEWRHQLAICAVSTFLKHAEQSSQGMSKAKYNHVQSSHTNSSKSNFWTSQDTQNLHGVALWALRSDVGSQVPYHLDYAEQIRYTNNIIVPPVLAGTLQCTLVPVVGGDYSVHLDGLDHYAQYGYKAAIKSLDLTEDSKWIKVPYKFNRMIIQSGDLPHLSTPVVSIGDRSNNNCNDESKTYRVIIGFNAFLHDVGPTVQAAPEHSDAFRLLVRKLRQPLSWMDVLQKNPRVRNALIKAKRQQDKNLFVQEQQKLDEKIARIIKSNGARVTVGDLIRQLQVEKENCSDDDWPNPTDIQVHIALRNKQGMLQLSLKEDIDQASDCILSMNQIVELR